jgi:hypothetical protein
MSCGNGYHLPVDIDPTIGRRIPLIQVFSMRIELIDGTRRVYASTDRIETDVFVTVEHMQREHNCERYDSYCFPTIGLPCPNCRQTTLLSDFSNPETCPHCGANTLNKHATF